MRVSCCCCLDTAASSSHHLRLLHHLVVLLIIIFIISSNNVALVVSALHVDEVGITDYVLRTAGHGDVGVRYAKVLHIANAKNDAAAKENDDEDGVSGSGSKSVWITSQSEMCPRSIVNANNRGGGGAMTTPNYYSDCSIAARNITTGALIWRVNACGGSGISSVGEERPRQHVTLATNTSIYSLDTSGIFRIWDITNGALQLDSNILDDNYYYDGEEDTTIITNPPRIFDLTTTSSLTQTSIIGTTIMSKSYMGGVGEKKKNKKKKEGEEKYDDELLLLLDTTTSLPISSTT